MKVTMTSRKKKTFNWAVESIKKNLMCLENSSKKVMKEMSQLVLTIKNSGHQGSSEEGEKTEITTTRIVIDLSTTNKEIITTIVTIVTEKADIVITKIEVASLVHQK